VSDTTIGTDLQKAMHLRNASRACVLLAHQVLHAYVWQQVCVCVCGPGVRVCVANYVAKVNREFERIGSHVTVTVTATVTVRPSHARTLWRRR
jgi:hypothetical protein